MAIRRVIRSQVADAERILAETQNAREKEEKARERLKELSAEQEKARGELQRISEIKKGVQDDLDRLCEEEEKKREELNQINEAENAQTELLKRLNEEQGKIQKEIRQIKGGTIPHNTRKIRSLSDAIVDEENKEEKTSQNSKNTFSNITLLPLSSVVKVGDYVNYPVDYDNVFITSDRSELGWRVLDIRNGGVRLVSSGIPLTYYYNCWDSRGSARDLTCNFLNIPKGDFEDDDSFTGKFICMRFAEVNEGKTLREIFDNPYTTSVSALTKEDIENVLGYKLITGDVIDNTLFTENSSYYLASSTLNVSSLDALWLVDYDRDGNYIDFSFDSTHGLRTVASLKSEVLTSGKDENGVWQICMP